MKDMNIEKNDVRNKDKFVNMAQEFLLALNNTLPDNVDIENIDILVKCYDTNNESQKMKYRYKLEKDYTNVN